MEPTSLPAWGAGGSGRVDGVPSSPGLTVSAVARRLGVAPPRSRAWARRYGLGPSSHVAGAHRRYSGQDVARLDLMRRMVDAGVSPGDAARAARSATAEMLAGDEPPAAPGAATPPPAPDVHDTVPNAGPRTAHVRGEGRRGPFAPDWESTAGSAEVLALPGAMQAAQRLARTVLELDPAGSIEVLEERIAARGVVWTWDQLLVPLLRGMGNRWAATGAGIEAEHVLTDAIITAMRAVVQRPQRYVTSRTVLLACVDEEQHSVPLYALAAALAERQVESRLLGARVPYRALVAAIRRIGPAAVVLWSSAAEGRQADATGLAELHSLRPTPLVLLAGPGWEGSPSAGGTVVHDLCDAITRITAVVG